MGCCMSSRRAEMDRTPIYLYCPPTSEPVSSANVTSSVSTGLLVNTNLDTSIPDTYRAPPSPLPYDVDLACPRTLLTSFENCGNKPDHMQPADLLPPREPVCGDVSEGSDISKSLKGSDCKSRTDDGCDTVKVIEDEPSKFCEPVSLEVNEEEDDCPICLEEYNFENPRTITKCEHHFHLACILEWMERSDTCPVCDQITMLDQTFFE
ncbi:Zinc finger RING/FYVE/PHD-type protein [Dioscorea alata]|uniref:Zinc finger RING/FYVE/PHD-type protein n=2 Tax=Dioscorea alata TaxID=55571 RepID=A0ACB7UQG2_DIOAL|nr:Zinc finger RING/FYVE/PHD-type protein [Dioscorea alata]KAH7662907.1 Zinc finger RING/FYVE/PHD-type protein [Dioscorea alata]